MRIPRSFNQCLRSDLNIFWVSIFPQIGSRNYLSGRGRFSKFTRQLASKFENSERLFYFQYVSQRSGQLGLLQPGWSFQGRCQKKDAFVEEDHEIQEKFEQAQYGRGRLMHHLLHFFPVSIEPSAQRSSEAKVSVSSEA